MDLPEDSCFASNQIVVSSIAVIEKVFPIDILFIKAEITTDMHF